MTRRPGVEGHSWEPEEGHAIFRRTHTQTRKQPREELTQATLQELCRT